MSFSLDVSRPPVRYVLLVGKVVDSKVDGADPGRFDGCSWMSRLGEAGKEEKPVFVEFRDRTLKAAFSPSTLLLFTTLLLWSLRDTEGSSSVFSLVPYWCFLVFLNCDDPF